MWIGVRNSIDLYTFISGGIALSFPEVESLKFLSAGSALLGLLLVIAGTIIVMFEGRIIYRQIHTELLDLPDLAESIGEEAGAVTDPKRHAHNTERGRS